MSFFLHFRCYGLVQTVMLILMCGSLPETKMACLSMSASQYTKGNYNPLNLLFLVDE